MCVLVYRMAFDENKYSDKSRCHESIISRFTVLWLICNQHQFRTQTCNFYATCSFDLSWCIYFQEAAAWTQVCFCLLIIGDDPHTCIMSLSISYIFTSLCCLPFPGSSRPSSSVRPILISYIDISAVIWTVGDDSRTPMSNTCLICCVWFTTSQWHYNLTPELSVHAKGFIKCRCHCTGLIPIYIHSTGWGGRWGVVM